MEFASPAQSFLEQKSANKAFVESNKTNPIVIFFIINTPN
jgi:hypothetical protein